MALTEWLLQARLQSSTRTQANERTAEALHRLEEQSPHEPGLHKRQAKVMLQRFGKVMMFHIEGVLSISIKILLTGYT